MKGFTEKPGFIMKFEGNKVKGDNCALNKCKSMLSKNGIKCTEFQKSLKDDKKIICLIFDTKWEKEITEFVNEYNYKQSGSHR